MKSLSEKQLLPQKNRRLQTFKEQFLLHSLSKRELLLLRYRVCRKGFFNPPLQSFISRSIDRKETVKPHFLVI